MTWKKLIREQRKLEQLGKAPIRITLTVEEAYQVLRRAEERLDNLRGELEAEEIDRLGHVSVATTLNLGALGSGAAARLRRQIIDRRQGFLYVKQKGKISKMEKEHVQEAGSQQ